MEIEAKKESALEQSKYLNTIIQGDSIEKLNEIPEHSVDLVFADPPFNIGYKYDVYNDRRSKDEYLAWSKKWISGVKRVLKPSGTFWLAIGDEFAAHLKIIAEDEVGFSCRSWVIWYYTFGVNCARGFSRSHTHLFHFVSDPDDFTFNGENPAVRVMSARQLVYGDLRANPKGRLPDNTWILRPQDAPKHAFRPEHDTWYFPRVAGTFKEREGFHGCQMPEQLLGRIIRICSHPREIVLDPFSGSGTTLAVAKKLGRQWIGIELSTDYVAKIEQRLAKTQVGDKLDGPENPVESAPATAKGRSLVRIRNGRPVPHADTETELGIIAAFSEIADGNATDVVLCDPELGARFITACEERRVDGNPYVWNRLLLRLRKAGRLPKRNETSRRLAFATMDSFSFASEIAMQLVSLECGMMLDDILCNPVVTRSFDECARSLAPGHSVFEYRWAALAIRKRAVKSRLLGAERFQEWMEKPLPKAISLAEAVKSFSGPGVYIVSAPRQELYVGETLDIRKRIEIMTSVEGWSKLNPTSLRFIPSSEPQLQHGLQSVLIQRLNTALNSLLLRKKSKAVEPTSELCESGSGGSP